MIRKLFVLRHRMILRFEEDLLLIPLAFESRLFKNDIRETRLGSVEDADDEAVFF